MGLAQNEHLINMSQTTAFPSYIPVSYFQAVRQHHVATRANSANTELVSCTRNLAILKVPFLKYSTFQTHVCRRTRYRLPHLVTELTVSQLIPYPARFSETHSVYLAKPSFREMLQLILTQAHIKYC